MENNIIIKIAEEYSKIDKPKTLIISPDNYLKYIEWDCKNQCLYNSSFTNPPDIIGLKVKIRSGNNTLLIK